MRREKAISASILSIIFLAWAYYVYANLPMMLSGLLNISALPFLFSLAFLILIYYFQAFIWHRILAALDIRTDIGTSNRIWFLTNLSKYIPGKLWPIVGKGYYGKKENLPAKKIIFSAFLEMYLAITTGTVLIAVSQFLYNSSLVSRLLWLGSSMLLVGLFFFGGRISKYSLHVFSRFKKLNSIGIENVDDVLRRMKTWGFGTTVIMYFFVWLLYGMWLLILISSVMDVADMQLFYLSFVWVFSFLAGFIIILVPGGIGVREGAMAAILASAGFPLHLSLTIPLLARLQTVMADGLTALANARNRKPGEGGDFLVLKETFGSQRFRLIRRSIEDTGSSKVLDVGCGTGHNLIRNSDIVEHGIGIDTDEKRLRAARAHARQAGADGMEFLKMSGFEMKYKNRFDMVLLTEVLEHVRDDDKLLERSVDSLKSGGHVLITSPSKRCLFRFIGKLRDRMGEGDHVRPGYTVEELTQMLRRHGVEVVEAEYHGQFFSSIIHYMASVSGKRRKMSITSKTKPRLYTMYSILWPVIRALAMLDNMIPHSTEGGFVFLLGKKS